MIPDRIASLCLTSTTQGLSVDMTLAIWLLTLELLQGVAYHQWVSHYTFRQRIHITDCKLNASFREEH